MFVKFSKKELLNQFDANSHVAHPESSVISSYLCSFELCIYLFCVLWQFQGEILSSIYDLHHFLLPEVDPNKGFKFNATMVFMQQR